ncbi:MAG: proline iminopeptidase-family hydrolase [Candidatus Omnitrophica bacterium]|jgi:proline iminopeptidase|nr:proline iminopeptidase-family hydrolase [Candidatus Omnitrophota bacterium]
MEKEIKKSGNVQEGYIKVTGGNIWYKICGSDKNKIPVIILHGGPAATHYYLEPLEALSSERPVIFYDQLGCGLSDKANVKSLWTIEHFVEELGQVRAALNLKNVHILGHSWGAMLATDYIIKYMPKGIASLVFSGACLSATMWGLDQRNYLSEFPLKAREIISKTEEKGNFDSKEYQDVMINYYQSHVCRLSPWPDCLKRAFSEMNYEIYKYMWGPSEFTITGILKKYDRINDLNRIKIPTLFTCGQFDEASPQTTDYYHKKIPQSEIFVFKDASHNHHLEKTNDYLEVVGSFIKNAD